MTCKHYSREIYQEQGVYYHLKNKSAKLGLDYLYCSEGESSEKDSKAEPTN